MTSQPLDLAPIQARADAATDPASCGTCRHHTAAGKPVEHPECARRATLLPAPDAPCYETILDVPETQRVHLPARFHIPVYDDSGTPKSWTCAVCWGDGWATRWPCPTALQQGRHVFTPEHLAEKTRADVEALVGEVTGLRAKLAAISVIKVWRNEDGREFLFADDVRTALAARTTQEN